jgi:hypothetical protein
LVTKARCLAVADGACAWGNRSRSCQAKAAAELGSDPEAVRAAHGA